MDMVLSAVADKRPFHLLRLGDGEAWALQSQKDDDPKSMPNRVWLNHNGSIPEDPQDKKKLLLSLRRAIRDASVLGVHSSAHHKCGTNLEYLNQLFLDLHATEFRCRADVHRNWLQSGQLDRLWRACTRVLLISGHDLSDVVVARYPHLTTVLEMKIPLEAKYFGTGVPHFPDIWIRTMAELACEDWTGTVCMYGAGFIGKSYGAVVQTNGGVAIDLGSVFDLWAGLERRGSNKGVCETWKL